MIIKDFNKMSLEELEIIHQCTGLSFVIMDGRIVDKENIPADRKSEQG